MLAVWPAGVKADRLFSLVALVAALSALAAGLAYGTFAAGGSDSSCYLSEARLLASGATSIDEPLARTAPWPTRAWTFAPAGHVPSRVVPGVIVPICPPGLPLAMAAVRRLSLGEGIVVPVLGALAVWLTFLLGRRIDGPLTGAAAAVLTATSPIFLCQIMQPMTDVPAAAWWLLAAFLALDADRLHGRAVGAGVAASFAVLTRPNLLPLAFVVAAYLVFAAAARLKASPDAWRVSVRAAALFVLGSIPGLIALGALQRATYGSPLASGYGPLGGMFAASHVMPNLERYPRWLIETQTPFLVLAVAAPWVCRRDGLARGAMWLSLALAAATLASYLPYLVFEEWWYIRFLLPAIPFLILPSVVVLVALLRRVAPRSHQAVAAMLVALLAIWYTREPQGRLAFELRDMEQHYVEAGTYVARRLPARAAVVTVKYSGSVHYYASRPTLAWDTLDPAGLELAFGFLREKGYQPYLLLATDEEPAFKARFGGASPAGTLDWPPMARLGRDARVYDPEDRARYLGNGIVRTEDVWSTPRKGKRR